MLYLLAYVVASKKSVKVPTSCYVCKKVPRKDGTIINCYKCTKSFHDICRPMYGVERSFSDSSIILHICKIYKTLERSAKMRLSTPKKGVSVSQEQLLNISLDALTPVHPVSTTKALATAKWVTVAKASKNRELTTSVSNSAEGNNSNGTIQTSNSNNNSSNNSSNNNGNNKDSNKQKLIEHLNVSEKEKDSKEEKKKEDVKDEGEKNEKAVLPPSRLSVFVPSPRQPVTGSPENSFIDRTSSRSPMSSSNKSSRFDSSTLKNGSTISSLVTYANCVNDTVEKAIISQQNSIASKLVEITDSLIVLPGLTQKIGNLVTKVEALEVLLAERTDQLHATQKECEQLREEVSKTDAILAKLAEIEHTLACLKSASTLQGVSNSKVTNHECKMLREQITN